MQSLKNPFQSQNPYLRNTSLLNYGESNMTMFHQLTRKSGSSKSRENILSEATILHRTRKQLYDAQRQLQKDTQSEYYSSHIHQEKPKGLVRVNTTKTVRNPFDGSYISAPFGSESATSSSKRREFTQTDTEKKKEMIRHEVVALKKELNKTKQLKKQSINSFSISNLYRKKIRFPDNIDKVPEENKIKGPQPKKQVFNSSTSIMLNLRRPPRSPLRR